jgi:hypothetical protein
MNWFRRRQRESNRIYEGVFTSPHLGCAIVALGILASCTAQTTRPTRVSEVKDRHNFRDEQEGAPRVDNAPIDR